MKDLNCWVVIVTFNSLKWIDLCLGSVNGFQVIVVDNNSQDYTKKYVKSHYSHVKVIELSENIGFGQANNIGISYALKNGAKHIFLLNQDAYLKEGSLKALINFQMNNEIFGILSPIHLNGSGSRLDKQFTNYVSYSGNKDFFSDFVLNNNKQHVYEVPFVNAAGWLLSRKCIEKVGGFDPIFFHYGEDDNYCQRAQYFGFKIGIFPNATLYHDRENRTESPIQFGSESYFRKTEIYIKKKYANINLPMEKDLEQLIKRRRKTLIKSYLQFKLKRIRTLHREYLLVKNLKKDILNSRKINIKLGFKYLENI